MKKVILFTAVFLITGIASAQKSDKKRFTTGFDLGVNHANYLLEDNSNGSSIENGFGFRMGLTSSFAFSNRVSFDPKAELSFNTSKYTDGTGQYAINPVEVEVMTHLKLKLRDGGISPYLLVGPNLRIPLARNEQPSVSLPTQQHLALDIGIGLDLPLTRGLRVSHELRYSIGLMNFDDANSIQGMKFHNISLILGFSGRPRL